MSQVLYILIAIVMLGFIVIAHEFGHYLVARLCGIGIVEFSVGFGPKLLGFRRSDIDYSLRLIPLGGYCAFVGEDGENPTPNAINNQPVWKRFLTVLAGPAMNCILAFLFCTILLVNFYYAEALPRIDVVYPGTPAAQSGVEVGDVVTSVNGAPVSFDGEGMAAAQAAIRGADPTQPIALGIERGGEMLTLRVTPEAMTDESGGVSYQIGIAFGGRTFTVPEALGESGSFIVAFTGEMLNTLKNLVFHGAGVENVMGPVGIITFVSDQVSTGRLYAVVNLIFFLSLNLGIMNLLPIPGLDGGRLIFLIVEAIRRKPVPPEKEGMVHAIGMGLLLLLILFVTYKDILRLITGG